MLTVNTISATINGWIYEKLKISAMQNMILFVEIFDKVKHFAF